MVAPAPYNFRRTAAPSIKYFPGMGSQSRIGDRDYDPDKPTVFLLYPRPSKALIALRHTMRLLACIAFSMLLFDIVMIVTEKPLPVNMTFISLGLIYSLITGLVMEAFAHHRVNKDAQPLVLRFEPADGSISVGAIDTV